MTGLTVRGHVVVFDGMEEDIAAMLGGPLQDHACASKAELRAFEIREGNHPFSDDYKVKLVGIGTGSFSPGMDYYRRDLEIVLNNALDERVGVYHRYSDKDAKVGDLVEVPYVINEYHTPLTLLGEVKSIRKRYWFFGDKVMVVKVLNFDKHHAFGGTRKIAWNSKWHCLVKRRDFWTYFDLKYVKQLM